ncbi:tetratricopeptide repeat protein [Melioribacter sp. OK-6-Me]|uniref:tetratricopeptide repeat protein n=1 Tax=unclassified Melioribacter TaxID=2627329 RepID=UPI003EDA1587
MKFKSIYIYLLVFIAFIVTVVFLSQNNEPKNLHPNMPDDEIHKGLKGQEGEMPSDSNVMEEVIQKLSELKRAYEENPNDTLRIREYADMLTMSHKPEEALKLYQKLHTLDPKRFDAMLQLTFIYFNMGELERAEEYTRKILKLDDDYPLALYNMGVIQQVKGNEKEAKKYWKLLIEKHPDSRAANNAKEILESLSATNQ